MAVPSCTTPFRRASSTSLSCECRGGGPESTSVLTLDGFKVWDPTIYELLPYTAVNALHFCLFFFAPEHVLDGGSRGILSGS